MTHRIGSAQALVAIVCLACGGEASTAEPTDGPDTTVARPELAAGGDSPSASLVAPSEAPRGWADLTLPEWIGAASATTQFASPDGERSLSYSHAAGARLDSRAIAGTPGLVLDGVSRDLGLLAGHRVDTEVLELWDLERGRILRRPSRDDVESIHEAGDSLVLVRLSFPRSGRRVQAEVHGRRSTERFALPSERVVMVSDDAQRVLLVHEGRHQVVDRSGAVLGRCDPQTSRSALSPAGSHLACMSDDAVVAIELGSNAR